MAPDKATIYPEHVGFKRPRNTCGKNFYELFLEALEEYPLRGFIRLDNLLIEAKKDFPLYFSTGTHWNNRGSVLASKVILERLSTPAIKFRLADIKFRVREHRQDLAALFSLGLREKSDYAIIKQKNMAIKITDLKPLANGRPRLKITAAAGANNPLLPRTIIYSDSFLIMPLIMIQGFFEEIDALWTHNFPEDEKIDFTALRSSKIVIIEVIERDLDKVKIDEKALVQALGNGSSHKKGKHKL